MGIARTLQAEQGTRIRVQTQAQSSGSGRGPDPAGPHGSVKHRAYALVLGHRQRGGGLRRKFLPRHWSGQSPAGTISDHQATQVRSTADAASMCDSTGTTYMRTGSQPVQYTLARTVHHMQAPAQVTGRMLCPRTSPARICGQAAPVSHVPPAWTAGLRQMHQNAARGSKLLCQRAPQSTHAGAQAASRAGHATS